MIKSQPHLERDVQPDASCVAKKMQGLVERMKAHWDKCCAGNVPVLVAFLPPYFLVFKVFLVLSLCFYGLLTVTVAIACLFI